MFVCGDWWRFQTIPLGWRKCITRIAGCGELVSNTRASGRGGWSVDHKKTAAAVPVIDSYFVVMRVFRGKKRRLMVYKRCGHFRKNLILIQVNFTDCYGSCQPSPSRSLQVLGAHSGAHKKRMLGEDLSERISQLFFLFVSLLFSYFRTIKELKKFLLKWTSWK